MLEARSRKHPKNDRVQDVTQARSRSTSPNSSPLVKEPSTIITPNPGTPLHSILSGSSSPNSQANSVSHAHIPPKPTENTLGAPALRAGICTWNNLKSFAKTLAPAGPIKAVANELVECIHIYERVSKGKEEYVLLQGQLEDIFMEMESYLSSNPSPTATLSVKNHCSAIAQELAHMKKSREKSKLKRSLESGEVMDDILACYRRVQTHLERLSLNINLITQKSVDEVVAVGLCS
ncbi:unnamed protein product [Rhizoctonia solani]|uniref:Uncharacterized protein n=1 Tax=Rhizoctonia solani TaxID=456999 RepID=A0A8H3C774_9AGAM|nr:unnamed protein product [Rhizoctonia solani]